jgi:hypothetical protein
MRHVAGKPVIQFKGVDERLPFDVGGLRAIDLALDDLEVAENAKAEFRDHVRSVEKEPTRAIENPVGSALAASYLQSTGRPEDANLAHVLERLDDLSARIDQLQPRFIAPTNTTIVPGAGPFTERDAVDGAALCLVRDDGA